MSLHLAKQCSLRAAPSQRPPSRDTSSAPLAVVWRLSQGVDDSQVGRPTQRRPFVSTTLFFNGVASCRFRNSTRVPPPLFWRHVKRSAFEAIAKGYTLSSRQFATQFSRKKRVTSPANERHVRRSTSQTFRWMGLIFVRGLK